MVNNALLWNRKNQLTILPVKTEPMLIRKFPFVGPLPPLYFGSEFIQVVEACLGIKLDNRLSWSKHIFNIRKNFMQKVGIAAVFPGRNRIQKCSLTRELVSHTKT